MRLRRLGGFCSKSDSQCAPPSATSGAGASLCNIARTVPAMPMSLWLRLIRERRLMTSFVRMSVENKVSDAVRKADA